jgi:dTDP-4-amino-4,6-dideoxygalactose transaminase
MPESFIPFFRPSISDEEITEVTNCLRSGWLTTGPNSSALEAAFAEALGGEVTTLAVTSATAALHLAVDALGIGPEDEVIVPTLTFTATAEVVRYQGAKPVFVDIDPDTLCLSLDATEAAITPRTKAIMPVHFAGRPCDMTALRTLADSKGLKIIDDAAHAFPAAHAGQSIGNCLADATAFSFYANKTMTTGEGGMLVTRDLALAARARTMRLHGIDRDVFNRFTEANASWIYDVVAPGYKYNMTDIAAAMGRVQLRKSHGFITARNRLAATYDAAFADLPLILPPHAAEGDTHSWHLYIVQLTDSGPLSRDEFISRLKEKGIGYSVHYRPLHQMTYWAPFAEGRVFPAADAYFDRCVTLPLFMDMSDDEQARVIQVVREALVKSL